MVHFFVAFVLLVVGVWWCCGHPTSVGGSF